MESVWMEKYRPTSLDGIVGQPMAVERLRPLTSQQSVPHLLLAGPRGTGKTTCALIVAREVLEGNVEGNFLEIDASDLTKKREVTVTETDDEGETNVRTVTKTMDSPLWRIKEFVSTASIDGVRFRVVFIDEVDTMSKEVQEALRRTMEVYSRNCMFILACNHQSMIIDPVRSRCGVVRFVPIPRTDLSRRIAEVAEAEGVELDHGAADGIAMAADGDMRRAMAMLQAAAVTRGRVDLDAVFAVSETRSSNGVRDMLSKARSGDFMAARDALDGLLIGEGMTCREIATEIQRQALELGLEGAEAVRLLDKVGETDFRIAQCGSGGMGMPLERVQLEHLLAYVAMSGRKRRRDGEGRIAGSDGVFCDEISV